MKRFFPIILTAFALCLPLTACGTENTTPGGTSGENGGNNHTESSVPPTSTNADAAKAEDGISFPVDQTVKEYTDGSTITEGGVYAVRGKISKKISVECDEPVELKFYDVTLSADKKVLEAEAGTGDLIITLSGENTLQNTNEGGSNGIDILGDLLIRGETGASLTMDITKNAIKANSITVEGTALNITSEKDALHAEIDRYDAASFEGVPALSYADGGFVHLKAPT